MSQLPHAARPSAETVAYNMLRKYEWTDSELLGVLFPQGSAGAFLSGASQNTLRFCTFLRQCLARDSYAWFKHPDCSRYNQNHGCILLQRITVLGYNQNNPSSMLEFLQGFRATHAGSGMGADEQRLLVYRLLNDAIGGPHGKVR